MGYGLGACIGAKYGRPDKICVNIAGDGCFRMNMQELATAMYEEAKVVVCILNNRWLGMVRQFQQVIYGKRYIATALDKKGGAGVIGKSRELGEEEPKYLPDFVKWAESYGAIGLCVSSEEDVRGALEQAKANKITTIIEFEIASEEIVLPMVRGGAPMIDMLL